MAVLLSITIIIPMCVMSASAHSDSSTSDKTNYITYNQSFYNANSELCDTLAEGMLNIQSQINIEKFKVSINDVKIAMRIVSEIYPELFYINKTTFSCAVGTYAVYVIPKYNFTASQIEEMQKKLDNRTNDILSKITPEMSQFQKTAIIHDEIILGCEYSNVSDSQYTRTSVYDCIVNGYSNCQGYTSSMSYLLKQVGIKSEIVESQQMNHVWNLVEIDGSYYHIDATFDDPTLDKFGFVSHKYFLLSDSAIKTSANIAVHYGYTTANSTNSTLFDNSYYKTINTKLCYVGKLCYAVDNNYGSEYYKKLIRFYPESDYIEPIVNISDKWYTSDGMGYWQPGFISTDELNGDIYFNLNNAVCKYTISEDTVHMVTDKIDTSNYSYIYGMKLTDNGNFYVNIKNSPTAEPNITTLKSLSANNHKELNISLGKGSFNDVKLGDIDNDGKITILDVSLIQLICTGEVKPTQSQQLAVDFNKDGYIDINDATSVQIFIAYN